jgi:hypothetical protein
VPRLSPSFHRSSQVLLVVDLGGPFNTASWLARLTTYPLSSALEAEQSQGTDENALRGELVTAPLVRRSSGRSTSTGQL